MDSAGLDSAGLKIFKKSNCSPETGVRWSPVDSAGLDSAGLKILKKSNCSPETGVRWSLVDSAGLDSARLKIEKKVTVVQKQVSSGVQWTLPDWTPIIVDLHVYSI